MAFGMLFGTEQGGFYFGDQDVLRIGRGAGAAGEAEMD